MTSALVRATASIGAFIARRKRLATLVQRALDRVPPLQDAVFALAVGGSDARYARWVLEFDTLDDADLTAMRAEQSDLADPPLLSVLVPTADGTDADLAELKRSLSEQVYERWELHVIGRSASAWNQALESAGSDYVVLVEPGVVLRSHGLFLLARTLNRDPNAALVYADEDVVDEAGARHSHHFKPDWNQALLGSQNYFGGFVCLRRSLAAEVGGCREELDGEYAWGLFLRMGAAAPPGTIHHLPFVLSHRRGSETAVTVADGERRRRVARALEGRLAELGVRASVEPVGERSYRTHYALPDEPPHVSVIVPTTANLELLRPCLDGLLDRTAYPRLELLVVVSGQDALSGAQREYLDAIAARPGARVLFHDDGAFNFSKTNSWAAAQATGQILCFLNDDTAVTRGDWLSELVAHVLQERVAAVGAMLLFPNGRIQHAGIVLGVGLVAGHAYGHRPKGIAGYHERALVDQDVSAVSAACMVVRRDVFLDVGGFDEELAIAFNDIDLCLRLRKAGWRIVWTPTAELYHRESASIVRHNADEREKEWRRELELMHSRWSSDLAADPHYNPNLSLDRLQLWEPAFPPRVSYLWRAAARGPFQASPDPYGSADSA